AHHDACGWHQSAADPVWLEADILTAVTRVIGTALVIAVLMICASAQTTTPRVFILDAKQLAPDLVKLERDARKALKSGPFYITDKATTPPSGDKHDYMSQAPYFWPDPKSPNGLPYIRRDGERNPEIEKITDHRVMDQMESAVETLALAYHSTRNEDYA